MRLVLSGESALKMGFCDAQEYGGDESAMGDYAERNVLATKFFSCAWVEKEYQIQYTSLVGSWRRRYVGLIASRRQPLRRSP